MPDPEKLKIVEISDWRGQFSNASPHDLPPGSLVEQNNMTPQQAGQLTCREGFRVVTFDAAAVTLESSRNVFQPPCIVQDQEGRSYILNGLDRGDIWNGLEATSKNLGVDAPTVAPTITTPIGGAATAGTYVCYYRYRCVDDTGIYFSSLSPVASVSAAANDQFSWDVITTSTDARVTHKQLFRSTSGQSNTLYLIATITNATTTYVTDTSSDAVIRATTAYPIDNADGTENMDRFTPPPDKAVAASMYDRFFYAVDVVYDEGSCEVTSSSPTVTGRGTAWTGRMVGRRMYFHGQATEYVIDAVGSATSITLSANYGGSTNLFQHYAIREDRLERNVLYYSRALEPESVVATENIDIQEHGDTMVGLMPLRNYLYAIKTEHMYRITMNAQGPCVCANAQYAADRGCVNNRSWATVDGMAYLLDIKGIHRFTDGSEHISQPIQDLWRKRQINFAASKWFFASVDAPRETIRWHVALGHAYLPQHAICYHYRLNQWWIEEYPWGWGGWGNAHINSASRPMFGGEFAQFWVQEGTYDNGTNRTIRGTATAATPLTITDTSSDAVIADVNVVGAPIAIVAGRGKGQLRRIISSASSVITVDKPWYPLLSAATGDASEYQIGSIPWKIKTRTWQFVQMPEQQGQRKIEVITDPTVEVASLDVRRYIDQQSTPENYARTQDGRTGDPTVTTTISDPDAVCALRRTKTLGEYTGYTFHRVDGRTGDNVGQGQFIALELRGYGAADPIVVHSLTLSGVE